MTLTKNTKKTGVSQRPKMTKKVTVVPPLGVLAKAKPMFDPKVLSKNTKPTQSELFVRSRNPLFQYAVDVFALAFVIALILVLAMRVVK